MKRSKSKPKGKMRPLSRRASAKRVTGQRGPDFTIFISHVHEEAPIAEVLRDWFHATFPGRVTAFVSSDYEDNPLGNRWLDTIDNAISQSRLLVTLLSPRSSERMWIHLEAGWALGRRIDILPLCHSGMRVQTLPRPYSDYSGTEVERPDFARRLLVALKRHLGLDHALPPGMLEGLTGDVRDACSRIQAANDTPSATQSPALRNAKEHTGIAPEEELKRTLLAVAWRLFFNPKAGPERSKLIRFSADGTIAEGGNQNEASWRVRNGRLELLDSRGNTHSRFNYDPIRRRFSHTNDPDTGSITKHRIRDQYLTAE